MNYKGGKGLRIFEYGKRKQLKGMVVKREKKTDSGSGQYITLSRSEFDHALFRRRSEMSSIWGSNIFVFFSVFFFLAGCCVYWGRNTFFYCLWWLPQQLGWLRLIGFYLVSTEKGRKRKNKTKTWPRKREARTKMQEGRGESRQVFASPVVCPGYLRICPFPISFLPPKTMEYWEFHSRCQRNVSFFMFSPLFQTPIKVVCLYFLSLCVVLVPRAINDLVCVCKRDCFNAVSLFFSPLLHVCHTQTKTRGIFRITRRV